MHVELYVQQEINRAVRLYGFGLRYCFTVFLTVLSQTVFITASLSASQVMGEIGLTLRGLHFFVFTQHT